MSVPTAIPVRRAPAADAGYPAPPADPDIRVEWTLRLRAETAFTVGGAFAGTTVDLTVARDGRDRPYIPGSSWAGVLRARAEAALPPDTVDALFGAVGETGPGGTGSAAPLGWASRLTVADTVIDSGYPLETRTGVGIDRRTGTAADRIRYDREVLPAGTPMTVCLRYDGADDAALAALRRLLRGLRADGPRVGAASRRGLGRMACVTLTERSVDLRSRAGLLAWFTDTGDGVPLDPVTDAGTRLTITVDWIPAQPVLVGAGTSGEGAHLVPLMTRAAGDGLAPVLPGSSVKGVLRSLTERIARTVLAHAGDPGPAGGWEPGGDFVAALDGLAAYVPALEGLFGSQRQAGALAVGDVIATVPVIDADVWADLLAGTIPDPADANWYRPRSHVAIDRWTGGAADQQLFTVQELAGVRWPPITLDVDLPALRHTLDGDGDGGGGEDGEAMIRTRAALVLLGCALGVFLDGDGAFGHGASRGLGEVRVTGLSVRLPAAGGLPALPDADATSLDELRELWWMWLDDLAPPGGWVAALPRPPAPIAGPDREGAA